MKRRLSLTSEHLTELTTDELAGVAGAQPGSSFTGRVDCILSLREPCVTFLCSALCNVG